MAKQLTLSGLILVIAGLLVWWWYPSAESGDSSSREGRAANVNVSTPVTLILQDRIEAVGTMSARNAVDIASEVDGRVVELRFSEGDQVQAGDILVVLDDRQARSDLKVAEARLDDARNNFARAERLRPSNNISEAEYDQRRSALQVAEAEKEAAETRLANRRIEAPFSGHLGLRDISRGAYVRAGDRITTLDTIEEMELNFSVPERFLGQLAVGQTLTARTDAFRDREFTGEVQELGARIDPLSRTLPVRAAVNNEDRLLRPGQFMTVSLKVGERTGLMVPEQAILTQGNEQYAYVVKDDTAERRTLQLGQRLPGQVEVREGLTGDEQVVITGQDRLRDGDQVRILDDPDAILSDAGGRPQGR